MSKSKLFLIPARGMIFLLAPDIVILVLSNIELLFYFKSNKSSAT